MTDTNTPQKMYRMTLVIDFMADDDVAAAVEAEQAAFKYDGGWVQALERYSGTEGQSEDNNGELVPVDF